ncbi:hypothetical protein SLA2020_437410 [Shorea laevis]
MDEEELAPAYGEDFLSPEYSPSPSPYMDEEAWAPAPYGEDFLSPEYPPSPSPYMDEEAWAPAPYEEDFLSPEYPPSPSPYMDEEAWAPSPYEEDFLSPEYPPSPSPYMDEEAWSPALYGEEFLSSEYPPSPSPLPSEIESGDYDSPLEAPALSPSTALPALGLDTEASPATPFNYSAEDDAAAFGQESEGSSARSEGHMTGFIIAVVCLVGLGGLLYKKRKEKKRSQEYKYYDMAKRAEP